MWRFVVVLGLLGTLPAWSGEGPNLLERFIYRRVVDSGVDLQARGNIRHVSPVSLFTARGLVREVYSECQRYFAPPAEPFLLLSPSPEALLGFWLVSYESFVPFHVARPYKEAIAVTVSTLNDSPYCEQAHRAVGLSTRPYAALAEAFRRLPFTGPLPGPAGAYQRWVLDPRSPLDRAALPEAAGVALVFHYINRLVNVFVKAPTFRVTGADWTDEMFRRMADWRVGKLVRSRADGYGGIRLARREGFHPRAGEAPAVLGEGRIAEAFALWADIMGAIRTRLAERIPASELARIESLLARGSAAGGEDGPAVRFASDVAYRSRSVAPERIEALRRAYGGDDRLVVDLASWAAYLTVKRVARGMSDAGR